MRKIPPATHRRLPSRPAQPDGAINHPLSTILPFALPSRRQICQRGPHQCANGLLLRGRQIGVFRIGPPADFAVGVDRRFLQSHRVCVVRNASRLYAIYARCPHKGCTPDWIASDTKFKCPCHESRFCMGSAFDGNGINCEGPAPRPLDRAHIEVDERGNVVADLSKLYQWPRDLLRSSINLALTSP